MDPRRPLPVLAVAALCSVLATLLLVTSHPDDVPAPARAHGPSGSGVSQGPVGNRPAGAGAGGSRARRVLAGWDARRARAWAAADVRGLRALYLPGSRSGRGDARMLAEYAARGLRVRGLTTQVLALRVLRESPRMLDLVVTDRVAGGVVVGRGRRVRLPADRSTTRRVVLREVRGRWLVAEVRDQASAAASTASTSSSSKS